ncbi:MAG: hypothetical protein EOM20_01200 [Spartobacteria bacterium]|nr:hypothetical protein [Spartobacteria bacterium]
MKIVQPILIVSAILITLLAHTIRADEQMEGTIKEEGFGKYSIIDNNGTELLLNVSKRETKYDPALWRPTNDDKINATYYEKKGRDGAMLVAKQISLVAAGPNTVTIDSPTTVTITESGRSGFITTLTDYDNKDQKFTRHRGTKMIPTGWVPSPGEKAVITFHLQPATFGFGIAYMADEVKKID